MIEMNIWQLKEDQVQGEENRTLRSAVFFLLAFYSFKALVGALKGIPEYDAREGIYFEALSADLQNFAF
ncbi:hypothetical protein SUGI_0150230 [Cryptomeria japonica]|nr:hypothetical protein SUGI_0150230 [Cryptomeria japonica]